MQTLRVITPRVDHAWVGWPFWLLNTFLAVLFFGPVASPLFRATALPLVTETGLLARDLLHTYVCPTPEYAYTLLGYPMAVCARCWGATIGLWAARLWLPARLAGSGSIAAALHAFRTAPWALRLLVCALPFLLWPVEIFGTAWGWWFAPLWVLLLNGMQAGIASGVFFCSVWPGFWPRK